MQWWTDLTGSSMYEVMMCHRDRLHYPCVCACVHVRESLIRDP